MSVRALGYIGIGVRDLKAWETFATSILGLQIGSRGDDGTLFLRMDEHHHRIAVHPGGNDDIGYLGWEVADERALEALAEKLHGAGFATRPAMRRPAASAASAVSSRATTRPAFAASSTGARSCSGGWLSSRRAAWAAFTPVTRASATSWSASRMPPPT